MEWREATFTSSSSLFFHGFCLVGRSVEASCIRIVTINVYWTWNSHVYYSARMDLQYLWWWPLYLCNYYVFCIKPITFGCDALITECLQCKKGSVSLNFSSRRIYFFYVCSRVNNIYRLFSRKDTRIDIAMNIHLLAPTKKKSQWALLLN